MYGLCAPCKCLLVLPKETSSSDGKARKKLSFASNFLAMNIHFKANVYSGNIYYLWIVMSTCLVWGDKILLLLKG